MPRTKKTPEQIRRQKHTSHCTICKHAQLKEIERLYSEGFSPYEIADKYKGVEAAHIYRHIHEFGLDEKRLMSSLIRVRRILDRAKLSTRDPSDCIIVKCLELEAKLAGELVDKFEGQIDLKISTDKRLQELLGRMLERLGFPEEKVREIMAQQITEEADG